MEETKEVVEKEENSLDPQFDAIQNGDIETIKKFILFNNMSLTDYESLIHTYTNINTIKLLYTILHVGDSILADSRIPNTEDKEQE